MSGLLRLPPLLTLAIILAIAAYVVYRIVEAGKAQPLPIIILIVLAFTLARVLFRMLRKAPLSESDD